MGFFLPELPERGDSGLRGGDSETLNGALPTVSQTGGRPGGGGGGQAGLGG